MGGDKDMVKSTDTEDINKSNNETGTKDETKEDKKSASQSSDSEPEGGFDSTQLTPSKEATYTVRIVFHSASNLPIADMGQLSSDPYVLAQLSADGEQGARYGKRHKDDPYLRFRSATAHSTTEPRWEAAWVVAGVPSSGFLLTARVYDEDSGTKDDRLGKVVLRSGALEDGWRCDERDFELKKRGASSRAWGLHAVRKLHPANRGKDPSLRISAEVLGKTEDECGKMFSLTSFWFIHYSPLIGSIIGTTSKQEGVEKANFQANELQLRGPVPNELYHRYVEFKAFIKAMFDERGLHGAMMGGAMRKQHRRVYHYDTTTEYGPLPGPGRSMAQRFLDMAHWGEGHRIFTFVITLDGLMRFTETGKEFGIDMLSKHAMHSEIDVGVGGVGHVTDVQSYIAYSGEFFVRKYEGENGAARARSNTTQEATGAKPVNEGAAQAHVNEEESDAKTSNVDYDAPSHSMLRPPKDVDEEDGVVETHDHNLVFQKHKKGDNDAGGANHPASSAAGDTAEDLARLSLGPAEGGPPTATKPPASAAPTSEGTQQSVQQSKATGDAGPADESEAKSPIETTHLHGREDGESSLDPAAYELVIDNDSGTYRPNKDLLPLLQAFLSSNLVGLHVTVKASDDDAYQDDKKQRHEDRNEASGGVRYYESESDLSSAASDAESEDDPDDVQPFRGSREKAWDVLVDPKAPVKEKKDKIKDKVRQLFKKDKGDEDD